MATTRVAVAPMKAAQIPKAGADFEIVEREIPKPSAGHVLIKVQACGVCHSDLFTKEGYWPGIQYPRVPGHEVAGIIDELGPAVSGWKKGQRVGVGWHGGHDGTCLACRRGDFGNCQNMKIAGISYDGGYQQYMVAPVEALTAIPEGLSDAEAAPLLCAGITTFNALRHSGAMPGDLVAVLGVGGLGHLGIQFANKFGYKVAAIGRGPESARSRRNSERACTSITRLQTQQMNYKNWVAHKSFSPPRQARKRCPNLLMVWGRMASSWLWVRHLSPLRSHRFSSSMEVAPFRAGPRERRLTPKTHSASPNCPASGL